jgi:hypothetical protein
MDIKIFQTRKTIIDNLIKNYNFTLTNYNYQIKTEYLKKKFNCICTDCGGNDSIAICQLESKYYKKIINL